MKKLLVLSLIVSISTFAQSEKAWDIKIGTAIPMIKFADLYTPGFSASLGYLMDFSTQTQVTLYTGYHNFPFDNEKYNAIRADYDNGLSFDLEAPITAIPLTLGIRYYLTDKKVKPYVLADFGFYYYTQKLSGSYVQDGQTVKAPPIEESAFSTTFSAGFGFTYPLSKMVVFDFVGKFNGFINTNAISSGGSSSTTPSNTSRTLYSFSILAGINYYME